MAEERFDKVCARDTAAAVVPRAVPAHPYPAIEIGCTDWYLYADARPEPETGAPNPATRLAAVTRRMVRPPGAWVKQPAASIVYRDGAPTHAALLRPTGRGRDQKRTDSGVS